VVRTSKEPVAASKEESTKRRLKREFEFWAIAENSNRHCRGRPILPNLVVKEFSLKVSGANHRLEVQDKLQRAFLSSPETTICVV